jgi:hypothetical protein
MSNIQSTCARLEARPERRATEDDRVSVSRHNFARSAGETVVATAVGCARSAGSRGYEPTPDVGDVFDELIALPMASPA